MTIDTYFLRDNIIERHFLMTHIMLDPKRVVSHTRREEYAELAKRFYDLLTVVGLTVEEIESFETSKEKLVRSILEPVPDPDDFFGDGEEGILTLELKLAKRRYQEKLKAEFDREYPNGYEHPEDPPDDPIEPDL